MATYIFRSPWVSLIRGYRAMVFAKKRFSLLRKVVSNVRECGMWLDRWYYPFMGTFEKGVLTSVHPIHSPRCQSKQCQIHETNPHVMFEAMDISSKSKTKCSSVNYLDTAHINIHVPLPFFNRNMEWLRLHSDSSDGSKWLFQTVHCRCLQNSYSDVDRVS